MAGKLSFSIALNLLTENFKKGTNDVRNAFRSMQAQILTFAAALGFAGVSLSNLLSDLIRVARETSKAVTSLKNVSGSTAQFASNLSFTTQMAKKYGVYVNDLTGNFAKFTAAASIAGMSMDDQRKLFESLSRASGAFALSADETNGVFLAITQMMGKGKIQAEELRGQLGERLPIAMQAMAKAAGTTVAGLDKIMKEGKLLSADVLPKLADALNEMLPNVDTDNIETSLNRLKNAFKEFTENTGIQGAYKGLVDGLTSLVNYAKDSMTGLVAFISALISGTLLGKVVKFFNDQHGILNGSVKKHEVAEAQKQLATGRRIDAEKTYEAIKTQYETKEEGKRLATKAQVTRARKALDAAEFAEKKAMLAATTAAENAAAIKSMGFWKRTGAVIVSAGKRISMTLKAAWSTVWPMALIMAISALVAKIISVREEAKKIAGMFSDYKKETFSIGRPEDADKLQRLYKIASDIKENENVRKAALAEINGLLGTSYSMNKDSLQINGDINTKVAERIKLLKDAAAVEFYQKKKLETEDAQRGILAKYGGTREGFGKAISASKNSVTLTGGGFNYDSYKDVDADVRTFNQLAQIAGDAGKQLEYFEKNILASSTGTSTVLDDGKKKKKTDLEKAEEEYSKSVTELKNKLDNRALTELEYKRELEKLSKSTHDTLSGLLTPEQATKNKTFQEAKAGLPGKTSEIENTYWDGMNKLSGQYAENLLTEKSYAKAKLELADKTLQEIAGMDDIGEAGKTFVLALTESADALRKEVFKIPSYKERDKTFDYKKTNVEKLQADRDSRQDYVDKIKGKLGSDADEIEEKIKLAKGNLDAIKAEYGKNAGDLIDALNDSLNNVTTLDEALKIAEVKKDIKDLSKELNEGMYSGIKDIASSSDRLVSAFSSLSDVMNDEDATAWERIMAVWNAMINTVDAFMSIVKTIESLTAITRKLTAAKQAEESIDKAVTATKVANAATQATAETTAATTSIVADTAASSVKKKTATDNVKASVAEGAAESGKSAAKLPFPWNIVAIGGAIAASIAAFALIPKFANGGIIQGSTTGDHNLARVNGGEMILNGHQQATLFQLANGHGIRTVGGGGDVEFKIKYDTLVGVLKTGDRNYRRGR